MNKWSFPQKFDEQACALLVRGHNSIRQASRQFYPGHLKEEREYYSRR